MKQSNLYMPMTKDISSQAVAISHIYSVKAGLVHQVAAGLYSYLPVATMMLNNIEKIIHEELAAIGANQVILPLLEPAPLWEKSGRWQSYGQELFRVKDRKAGEFALAPTHEEVITHVVSNYINSYKKFPLNLYQIGTKMRDELRPRFGMLRAREFVMMDGYSFHADQSCLEKTYYDYHHAYEKIFTRLGLEFRAVKADNGQMGGSDSQEYMALADIGEDTIVYEKNSQVAFNIEVAPVFYQPKNLNNKAVELTEIHTPNCKTVEQLKSEYDIDACSLIKSVLYNVDGQLVMALVRGDRVANEIKVLKAIGGNLIDFAENELITKYGLVAGFVGPLNVSSEIKILVDQELVDATNHVVGANKLDTHLTGVNYQRDLAGFEVCDIRNIEPGDQLSKDSEIVSFAKGIEVGHIFALGDKYAKDLNVEFLDKQQKKQTPVMGCYGIGVSRIISALIEQSHDQVGIVMPKSITPFDIHLLVLDYQKNKEQKVFADALYEKLKTAGYKVLLDDRDERPGVKFSEADLIGFPTQIIVGRNYQDNIVEVKDRKSSEKNEVNVEDIFTYLLA